MSRRLRYVPSPMVVEVTCRTVHGRFLLSPSPLLNRLIIGILARAQRMYDMKIHAFCVMSNHYHLLLTVQDARQLARFMNFVQSNVAREAGRLSGWRERFWGRRYQAILVSDESAAQLARLRYILSQGCKEGLVRRPEAWRGAHCVRQLLNGESSLQGIWIDRTALYQAAQRRGPVNIAQFTSDETLALTPLPCFQSLTASARREWIRDCVEQIATEARPKQAHRAAARPGARGRSSTETPHHQLRSPAPWFHVASANAGRELRVSYALFLAVYRSAAEKLRRGLEATFPERCFPPARPYIVS